MMVKRNMTLARNATAARSTMVKQDTGPMMAKHRIIRLGRGTMLAVVSAGVIGTGVSGVDAASAVCPGWAPAWAAACPAVPDDPVADAPATDAPATSNRSKPSQAADPSPETITIRGERLSVWPRENLIARGFKIRDLPREQNAAWTYIEAMNAYVDPPPEVQDMIDNLPRQGWPADTDKLNRWLSLEGNQRAIEKMLQASHMDDCAMPYFGDSNRSIVNVLLPNLSPMRMLARIVVWDGRRLGARGEPAKAAERHLAVLRMGGHLSQGGTLIENLVGLACASLGVSALTDMFVRDDLPRDMVAKIVDELGAVADRVPNCANGLENEKAFAHGMVDELTAQPSGMMGAGRSIMTWGGGDQDDAVANNIGAAVTSTNGWRQLERRLGRLIMPDRTVKKHMDGFYDAFITRSREGYTARTIAAYDEDVLLARIPQWDIVSHILLPSLTASVQLSDRMRTQYRLARLAGHIRLYMLDHDGASPTGLSQLGLDPSDPVFVDPFGRKPLRYMTTETGWVVYSVGPNLIDDGGQAGKRWRDLDIAVTYPPEPETSSENQ